MHKIPPEEEVLAQGALMERLPRWKRQIGECTAYWSPKNVSCDSMYTRRGEVTMLYLRVARGARMESGHARTVVGVLSVFVEVKSKVGGVPLGCGSQTKFHNPT